MDLFRPGITSKPARSAPLSLEAAVAPEHTLTGSLLNAMASSEKPLGRPPEGYADAEYHIKEKLVLRRVPGIRSHDSGRRFYKVRGIQFCAIERAGEYQNLRGKLSESAGAV